MELLDEEDSWRLLRQKVFAGGSCPPGLEKSGRKISEKCDGLPLLILTVADQLHNVKMSQEYWNNVVSGKEKSVFKNAHDQISEALLPSYQSLPQHLKPCFLYIGVFREKYEITPYELDSLWISEGFLEPNSSSQMEEYDFVNECFYELVDRSLVILHPNVSGYEIKACRLHLVYWHLSNSQAMKNKFFHSVDSIDNCSEESIESQRRLCIRNSILLGMKYMQSSMESNTSAHSLLCVGPLQQYPVPLNFDLKLLMVMNATTIRLYKFPIEVVRLVHLRFLGLTCNGEIPTSISKLWKLQHLILKRYMSIKSLENSYWALPVEIWDMNELKHLEVMGGRLPDHTCGAGLLKLETLLDVSAQSCREEVLKWIPNLKSLGIRIELAPDDEGTSFLYLNNISHLCGLESLKCVVVNPQIGSEVVAPPAPLTMFPASLERLSLSGLGYPWEYMSIIGELENLKVLKLKHYAFQGPKWEIGYSKQFQKLEFLLVQDTNLVHWKIQWATSMNLKCLCLKHCYKLKELSMALGIRRKIEVVDCSPFTETWVEQMGLVKHDRQVNVKNSWSANTHQE